ncbi:hypothetical protein [Winogradskyella marincola]|uniref:YhhN-like protein n=1 Tax=Winogradskyella marincola TaxID=3037795 RepID=A0ABT6G5F0_9FLAO|nr:hypothetical protein [Winogradskyella sp. YYF002]MDG4717277.1 hypothetical protein [Winogradskyella sp. YYF002]
MLANKILKALLLLLGGIFIILQGLAYEVQGAAVSAIMLVLLTILYCVWTDERSKLFFWFLVFFSIGHLLSYTGWFMPLLEEDQLDIHYYGANALFIVAYVLLIVKVLSAIDVKKVFKELSIPIVILVVLDVFCVVIVTDATEGKLSAYEYALEFIYNGVIMALLSAALVDYMYRNDNKSMLFLLGSICIVFSEIIQLAYYYILENRNLGFIYSFFLVVAFVFFYLQSQLKHTGPQPTYLDMDEQLEA